MVRDHLPEGPVQRFEFALAHQHWLLHASRPEPNLDRDAIRPAVRAQVRQRLRVPALPRRRGAPEGRQRLACDHPGRNRGGEVLGQERPERLILPRLNVPRGPIVQQANAEQMLFRFRDRDGFAHRASWPEKRAELHLIVKAPRRRIDRWPRGVFGDLSPGAADRCPADHDRRAAPVIGDGHPLVVRQQRVFRPEHAAHIPRVVYGGVEIGVVADATGQKQLDAGYRPQKPLGTWRVLRQESADALPQLHGAGARHRHHV